MQGINRYLVNKSTINERALKGAPAQEPKAPHVSGGHNTNVCSCGASSVDIAARLAPYDQDKDLGHPELPLHWEDKASPSARRKG